MTPEREDKLARKRELAKLLYEDRKARQVCVRCEAGLQDDDSVRCLECEERDLDGKRKRSKTVEGRKLARERSDRDRARRLSRGLCMYCTAPRADGQKRCQTHVEMNRAWQRDYRARKKQGITPIAPLRRAFTTISARPTNYRPLDEQEQNMRVRVLRAVYWLTNDGSRCTSNDMLIAMNVDMSGERGGSNERNAAESMLRWLVKYELVERTGAKGSCRYRITDGGKAEVKRYRAGDLSTRARRAA